jgi:hypothetical protein
MNPRPSLVALLLATAILPGVRGDWVDELDDALTWSAAGDNVRWHLSGTLDLEYYRFQQPAPGLIDAEGRDLFNPRLALFLDAQLGARWYGFAQARADRGFDPGGYAGRLRLDEYALRYSVRPDASLAVQIGKFATVAGNWVARHQSWDNPFVTAPLPYENPTGIFDGDAALTPGELLLWSDVRPGPAGRFIDFGSYRVPVIWGPSYASGLAVSGESGRLTYALEVKNAALSSRPEAWGPARTQWQDPTVTARFGWKPDESWNLGLTASTGTYLRPEAAPTLAPGRVLSDYRENLLGTDLSYAWHHWQLWAECFLARFEIPGVGNADTFAYYVETKYKFTPQFFGAVRWNQQLFGTVADGPAGQVRWGRNMWRLDVAPAYRFTPHALLKVQYSVEHGRSPTRTLAETLALQVVLRF